VVLLMKFQRQYEEELAALGKKRSTVSHKDGSFPMRLGCQQGPQPSDGKCERAPIISRLHAASLAPSVCGHLALKMAIPQLARLAGLHTTLNKQCLFCSS